MGLDVDVMALLMQLRGILPSQPEALDRTLVVGVEIARDAHGLPDLYDERRRSQDLDEHAVTRVRPHPETGRRDHGMDRDGSAFDRLPCSGRSRLGSHAADEAQEVASTVQEKGQQVARWPPDRAAR
jgi:hypothetical protein